MFEKFGKKEPDNLEALIMTIEESMAKIGPDDDKYPTLLAYLERLNKLKTENSREPINSNTVLSVAGNLMGILLIVAYEQKHVMTTKAFGWIKPK